MHQCDAYLQQNIEDLYPEIAKSIQLRRAFYFMLVHQNKEIKKMQQHGQIEEREAGEMKAEVDEKMHELQLK